MQSCLNCKYARLACNAEYVGCAYCETQLQRENPITIDDLMYDLQVETLNTGWVYLLKRPDVNEQSKESTLNILTSGVPVFRKDFLCRFYEAYNVNDRLCE